MKSIKKYFCIGALTLLISGCVGKPIDFKTSVDLNGDKRPDLVTGELGEYHFNYIDYNIKVKLSNLNGTYQKTKRILQIKGRPDNINVIDCDQDGDLDLVFSKYKNIGSDSSVYETYVSRNDGKGNFSEPVLISEEKK